MLLLVSNARNNFAFDNLLELPSIIGICLRAKQVLEKVKIICNTLSKFHLTQS